MTYIVGIDPGVHTGFAMWDPVARQFEAVSSAGIVAAMLTVQQLHAERRLASVVWEDARMRNWFGTKGRESLQGAGSIKRDCQVWEEWLTMLRIPNAARSPQAKGAKVDQRTFRKLSGWTGRTNEHARDAAMLVLGLKA